MTTNSYPSVESRRVLKLLAGAGALVLAGGILVSPERIWSNLLVGTYYLLTLALGGTVFVALAYVCGAGWHVAFRRVPEALGRMLPVAAAAMLVVLGVKMYAYGWHAHAEGDPGTFWFKEFWLSPPFWMARAVAYVILWSLISSRLLARSRRQDESGDPAITAGNVRLSALFLVIYAVTFSLASADWMMALEPMWFSTMWGVYNFAGMIQGTLAAMVVLGLLLRSPRGPLSGIFSDEHLHDLGKLLLGFSCFWMYIWFSQYMLIWYSNIPEETSYFIVRTRSPWGPVVVVSILLNWLVPFFLLLPRPAKRNADVMMKVACAVLIGRWVDLYLMVFPSTLGDAPVFAGWEVAGICCLAGCGSLLVLRCFAMANAVPSKDPYLAESLHYHAG